MINHRHSKGIEGVVGLIGLKLKFVHSAADGYHRVLQIHVTQSNVSDLILTVHSRFSGR